jgi:hypothetical protein
VRRLGIEGVLADKILRHHVASEANVPRDVLDRVLDALTPHVAAAVLAEVRAWLESEGAYNLVFETYRKTGKTGAALAALAEQVGQVASVGEGEG